MVRALFDLELSSCPPVLLSSCPKNKIDIYNYLQVVVGADAELSLVELSTFDAVGQMRGREMLRVDQLVSVVKLLGIRDHIQKFSVVQGLNVPLDCRD